MRNGKSTGKVLPNNKNEIKSMINSSLSQREQLKWATQVSTISSVSTTLSIFDFTTVSSGTTSNTRVGTSISPKKAHFRGQIILGDTTNLVRFFVFRWHPDNNSDTPTSSEIFASASDPLSDFVYFKQRRFTILYDQLYSLDTYHPTKLIDFELDLGGSLNFTSGNNGAEHIYVAMVSDSTAAPHPSSTMDVGFRWVDKY